MAIKRPKLKKYRKKPKTNASIESKESWKNHAAEVDKENNKRISDWKAAVKKEKSDKEKSKKLSAEISGKKKVTYS